MELLDIVITAAIVLVALWYLYRKIIVTRGCSCDSSSSCAKKEKHPRHNEKESKLP